MYRIRSTSGNEVTYNSLEEFSAAVRRGEVHPEDEIFHTRANRWLDVKSHPHYRSATTWQHHEPAATVTSKPASPTPSGGTSAQPVASSSRAQVFERPVVRTAPQTTVRPQLQPDAKATAGLAETPAPAPAASEPQEPRQPRKSKELAFIDVGDVPGTKPLPSLVAAPAVRPEPKPAPAPAPERPAARAAVPAVEPPAPPPVPAPAPAPKAAAPAPAPAPAPAQKKAAAIPDTEAEFLVMDGGIESPVRTSAGHKTVPEDMGLLFDAPLPKEASVNATSKVPAPAAAAAQPAPAPAPQPAGEPTAPPRTLTARSEGETDMEVLPATLLEAPVPELDGRSLTAPEPSASRGPSGSRGMLLGGGAAMLVAIVGLLAWKPWKSATPEVAVADPAASAVAIAASAAPTAGSKAPAPAPMPIRTTSAATVPAGGKGSAKPADSAAIPPSTDSGADEIIAASKPSFRTDLALPAPTDFGVGDVGGSTAFVAPSELVRRLAGAERQAQQDLNTRLAVVGFRNVLAGDQLGSASGVASAKAAWSAGADAIRQYRGRIARLERAYEDSVLSAQRGQRWSSEEMRAWASRQSLAEPSETSQLADLMFSQVNEGLDILAALSGEYSLKSQGIAFKNAASATRYTSIRNWVEQRTSSWSGIPESARPHSVTAILRALGDGFPVAQ